MSGVEICTIVDVRTVGQGLISPWPAKHQLGIDPRIAMLCGNGVKVLLALVQLVRKEVGQSDHARVVWLANDVATFVPRCPQPSNPNRIAEFAAVPRTSCGLMIMIPAAPAAPRNCRLPIFSSVPSWFLLFALGTADG